MNWLRSVTAASAAILWASSAWAAACDSPHQMDGFKTCADVEAAEKEGQLILYSTDPETNMSQYLGEFHKMFPKIATNFVRLQAGALYAKVNAERQAKQYLADVMQITDMSFVLDFQKRKGYVPYASPKLAAYKPEYKSNPEGLWAWGVIIVAGIAYNPNLVPADQAPKNWKDLLDPKWKDVINVKISTSGLQHVAWYMIREIYGDEYWKKFAELNPHAFDSYVQQFDRTVNGQDKVISTAQVLGLSAVQGQGCADRFRQRAGGPRGDARRVWHPGEPAAPAGLAAVHGLDPRRAWTEGAVRRDRALFTARRRAATGGRHPNYRIQGVGCARLGRVPQDA